VDELWDGTREANKGTTFDPVIIIIAALGSKDVRASFVRK